MQIKYIKNDLIKSLADLADYADNIFNTKDLRRSRADLADTADQI